MTVRNPAVAGQFYPGTKQRLQQAIAQFVAAEQKKITVTGVVSPHAGYPYSGSVAGKVFSGIKIPDAVVVLGPNHTGFGESYAINSTGSWLTPLGEVLIAEKLAKSILANCSLIQEDVSAHRNEHSLEVQLPFLQYFNPGVQIVPLVIGDSSLQNFSKVGAAIAGAIRNYKEEVLIVASSDMSHYEPKDVAKRKDDLVIEAILALDAASMLQRVAENNISMCGYAPTAVMLQAAKELGAQKAELVSYMTSGDTTGDYSAVVGYAGIIVY